jgi:hypothetical protein
MTLSLHDYAALGDGLPDPGPQDFTPAVTEVVGKDWGMDGNDTVGDCACAMVSHITMVDTANNGQIVIPSTADTLALYSAVTGYDPSQTAADGSNPTDQGTVMTDLLAYLQKVNQLEAWAEFETGDLLHYRQVVNLFGAAMLGVQVRQCDMNAFRAGDPWDKTTGKVLGGHAVPVVAADVDGVLIVTWGALQRVTYAWLEKNCDEAYAGISNEWLNKASQETPSGFNLSQLTTDIALLHANG